MADYLMFVKKDVRIADVLKWRMIAFITERHFGKIVKGKLSKTKKGAIVQPKTISQGNPGEKFVTDSKTITQEEQTQFCNITANTLPIFMTDEAAQAKGWERRLVPGAMTMSCSIGLMEEAGLLDDVIAFMGMEKLRYLAPVYIGDTLHVEAAFIDKKPVKDGSRSIIFYKFQTINQNGIPVLEAQNS
jgi:acyl dehydratase